MNEKTSIATRLEDLECKFSFQQETLDVLNDAVTSQWQHIEQLEKQIRKLTDQMVSFENDLADSSGTGSHHEPPPPHY
ncbi:SlyX family protein [Kordiimonas pumila]|uniref:Protein SlyX homolog n=1 Tax=Kordiimonas pumila TaxID=2161677 RepID=A0ABV7D0H5_9PROT|nr:SlyX family protein [Kordiimonas pumila]